MTITAQNRNIMTTPSVRTFTSYSIASSEPKNISEMTKLVIYCIIALGALAFASASLPAFPPSDESTQLEEPFATRIARWTVDVVSQKVVTLARFFNLKFRIVRFLVSLYTTENLMLFRTLTEYGVHLGNLVLKYLPESTENPGYWWVPAFTEFVQSIGTGGIFSLFIGEPIGDSEEPIGEASEIGSFSTNPPIFFNAPASSTEQTDSNDVLEDDFVRRSRSTERAERPKVPVPSTEELLQMHRARLMSLDKLINAKRK